MPVSSRPSSFEIQQMFERLAPRYDIFNHLTSMGLAVLWRRDALRPVQPGMAVLDIGCGTGDLTLGAASRVGKEGSVTGLDFSENMLVFARKRAERAELNGARIRFVLKKAEELPLEGQVFDVAISGFVLRNIYENIDAILDGVYRSLKNGGQISFLDITEPGSPFVRGFWRFYMNSVVAFYGKMLFGRDYPVFYLTDSAKRFLNAEGFVEKLRQAGFKNIRVKRFMFGIIALYQAEK